MPVFHVEMRWRCSTCQSENLGRHKTCLNCGKPKGRESFYDAPGTENSTPDDAITDPELIKQATAGSDWECAFCRSHQRRDSGECVECGAPNQAEARKAREKWDWEASKGAKQPIPRWISDTVREAMEAKRDAEIDERVEAVEGRGYRGQGEKIPKIKLEEEEVEEALRPPSMRSDSPTPPPVEIDEIIRPPFWSKRRKWISIGVLAASLVGVLCYFLFRTRIVDATVTAVNWTHIVAVERYQITTGQGFDEDQPGDAFDVTPVGMRHHHYKQVQDGTKQVPYTEQYQCGTTPRNCYTTPVRCTDNGNGFKSCSGGDRVCSGGDPKYCTRTKYRTEPKYKDVSVEEMYYHWKVWRWQHNRNIVAQGTDDEPYWPTEEEIALNKNVGEGEKERTKRLTEYVVTFTDIDGEKHTYKPEQLNEFRNLPIGTNKRLRVGIARGTEIVKENE